MDFRKAYTNTYWVTFSNHKTPGCIVVKSDDDVLAIAGQHGTVSKIEPLPYPARPVLHRAEGSDCPEFCYTPQQCKGRTACPKNYACSE